MLVSARTPMSCRSIADESLCHPTMLPLQLRSRSKPPGYVCIQDAGFQ